MFCQGIVAICASKGTILVRWSVGQSLFRFSDPVLFVWTLWMMPPRRVDRVLSELLHVEFLKTIEVPDYFGVDMQKFKVLLRLRHHITDDGIE